MQPMFSGISDTGERKPSSSFVRLHMEEKSFRGMEPSRAFLKLWVLGFSERRPSYGKIRKLNFPPLCLISRRPSWDCGLRLP